MGAIAGSPGVFGFFPFAGPIAESMGFHWFGHPSSHWMRLQSLGRPASDWVKPACIWLLSFGPGPAWSGRLHLARHPFGPGQSRARHWRPGLPGSVQRRGQQRRASSC